MIWNTMGHTRMSRGDSAIGRILRKCYYLCIPTFVIDIKTRTIVSNHPNPLEWGHWKQIKAQTAASILSKKWHQKRGEKAAEIKIMHDKIRDFFNPNTEDSSNLIKKFEDIGVTYRDEW
eukprot:414465_1